MLYKIDNEIFIFFPILSQSSLSRINLTMDNIIRTFEEKFADAGKLEKEVEQLKKLRADIDKKMSEKMKSPLMWYNQHQEMLPQLQTEIKHLKDVGLEEPITFDDKMDYAITRSELADVFSKHFVDTLIKDVMPFHGDSSHLWNQHLWKI
jgi:hypothetical protein